MSEDFEEYKKIAYFLAGKFLKKYGPMLYHLREDIQQQAVLSLLTALKDKDKVKGSLTTYIYSAVHNELRHYIQNVFKHRNLYLEDIDINLGYDLDFRFMLDLTEEEKLIFDYYYIEGNTVGDTARKFNMRKEDTCGAINIIKSKVIHAIKHG